MKYLTDEENDALVQHLRAQNPSDEALKSALKKLEADRLTRKEQAAAARKRKTLTEATPDVPINRFFNPGVPTGYSPPRRVVEGSILKTKLGEEITVDNAEDALAALGL